MGPLAAAGYVSVVSNAVLAIVVGASAGAVAWAINRSILGVGLLAAAGYVAETALLGSSRLAAAAIVGMPPLILTLLISWLTACFLETRVRVRRLWATLIAVGGAVLVGFLWLFLFRVSFSAPLLVALAADIGLIVLLYRTRSGGGHLGRC